MMRPRSLAIAAALLLLVFEFANVWFIMPLPGSQKMRSLEVAYALYSWRWLVRGVLGTVWGLGTLADWRRPGAGRWGLPLATLAAAGVAYVTNARMAADRMFLEPRVVRLATLAQNTVPDERLVVGVAIDGDVRAYPLQVIGYHHQVRDSIAGRPVLVTYCTVCRTGRVFSPMVEGRVERFRLVGMDHFNAMLEDTTTGSWWRQANGEAVIGPRRGTMLEELPSRQMTLRQWRALYPETRVLQPDPAFAAKYAKDYAYERGTSRSRLTRTDPRPWQDKSWVVGLTVRGASRAYDWRMLVQRRALHDTLAGVPVVVVLGSDTASFAAFVRPDTGWRVTMVGDSLATATARWALSGRGTGAPLEPLAASQEFWHSWRTFQPKTSRYLAAAPSPP